MKIDLSEAFDRVEWKFVLGILKKSRFQSAFHKLDSSVYQNHLHVYLTQWITLWTL